MSRVRTIPLALVELSLRRPRWIIGAIAVLTVVLGAAILRVQVDTDPENMLRDDNPVRVLNESLAEDFGLGPVIALGIVDEVETSLVWRRNPCYGR